MVTIVIVMITDLLGKVGFFAKTNVNLDAESAKAFRRTKHVRPISPYGIMLPRCFWPPET